MRCSHCGLVKDGVDSLHQVPEEGLIANIADHKGNIAGLKRLNEIFCPPPDHVVEHDHVAATDPYQEIDDMRPDESGSAGDQNTFSSQDVLGSTHRPWRFGTPTGAPRPPSLGPTLRCRGATGNSGYTVFRRPNIRSAATPKRFASGRRTVYEFRHQKICRATA
jgi:hypothetical protein